MSSVGSLAWARRTRGRLSRRDQLTLLAQAAVAQLNQWLGRRGAPVDVDVASLRIPDSALCMAAQELVVSVSEPWLVNHCLRAFVWATILGKKARLAYDEELLFVAAALHDLGLTNAGPTLTPTPAECFAVEGAFGAEAFLKRQAVEEQRRERIVEAISLHLNVTVPLKHGIEAHLLHDGTALDVIGRRHREIGRATIDGVLRSYPRGDITNGLVTVMRKQAEVRPRARAAFLAKFGFIRMIQCSTFARREG